MPGPVELQIPQLDPAVTPLTGTEQIPMYQGPAPFPGGKTVWGYPGAIFDYGSSPLSGRTMSQARTTAIANPTSLTFSKRGQIRLIEPLSPALTLLEDHFEADWGYYPNTDGSPTRTYNKQLSITPASTFNAQWTNITFQAPFIACVLEIGTKGAGATFNDAIVGIHKDTATDGRVHAFFDFTNNTCFIEVAGRADLGSVSFTAGTAPIRIAFVLAANQAHAFYQGSSGGVWLGWQLVTSASVTTIDFRDPAVLSGFHPGFGCVSGGSTTWVFNSFKAGYYGQTALRDPRIVVHKNGAPYIVNGEYYWAMTCGVPRAVQGTDYSGAYSHQGIFAYNPTKGSLRKTGALFVNRSSLVLNDHVSSIIYDDDIRAWRVFTCTWGNKATGTQLAIEHQTFKGELLNAVTVLDNMANLSLTSFTGTKGVYDPSVIYDTPAGLWRIAYVAVPDTTFSSQTFYPVLDTSPDLVTFTNVFNKTADTGYEGACLIKLGGVFYALYGSNANMKAYNMAGTNLGSLNITLPSTSNNPPWPAVYPVMTNNKTYWKMLTFDNTTGFGSSLGQLGTLCLYDAAETETGFEFDLYGVT